MLRIVSMLLLLGLGLGVPSGRALAQEAGVSGELERVAATSSQEKIAYVAAALEEMDSAIKSVTKLVDAARRDADVERLQCLNNRLVTLKSLAQVSDGAQRKMEAAIAAGESDLAAHETRRVAVALSKSRQLLAEAEGCGFEGTVQSGETQVIVEGGEIGSDDDTQGVENDVEVGFDAPEASPFM